MIELLVTIVISAILTNGIIQLYLNQKTTFLIETALARIQENGRYVAFLLNRDVRMAGFQGCNQSKQMPLNSLITVQSSQFNFTTPIEGHDANGASFSPVLPNQLSGLTLPDSDVIEIKMASPLRLLLKSPMLTNSDNLILQPQAQLTQTLPFIITDCQVGDMFMGTPSQQAGETIVSHTTPSNISNNLSIAYAKNAQILSFLYYAYYIRDTGKLNTMNQPIYALVRQHSDGTFDTLVEGVEKMKINYGVDTNNDNSVDSFQSASQVTAANLWGNVMSIDIRLLLVSDMPIDTQTKQYTFNHQSLQANDKRLRREWQFYITLRNRVLPA